MCKCWSTRSVRHIHSYQTYKDFLGLYCCWLSRGSDKARFSDSGVLSAQLTPSSSSSSSPSSSSSSSSHYSGTEQNEITQETIENKMAQIFNLKVQFLNTDAQLFFPSKPLLQLESTQCNLQGVCPIHATFMPL